jgi:hypothetical protein
MSEPDADRWANVEAKTSKTKRAAARPPSCSRHAGRSSQKPEKRCRPPQRPRLQPSSAPFERFVNCNDAGGTDPVR